MTALLLVGAGCVFLAGTAFGWTLCMVAARPAPAPAKGCGRCRGCIEGEGWCYEQVGR